MFTCVYFTFSTHSIAARGCRQSCRCAAPLTRGAGAAPFLLPLACVALLLQPPCAVSFQKAIQIMVAQLWERCRAAEGWQARRRVLPVAAADGQLAAPVDRRSTARWRPCSPPPLIHSAPNRFSGAKYKAGRAKTGRLGSIFARRRPRNGVLAAEHCPYLLAASPSPDPLAAFLMLSGARIYKNYRVTRLGRVRKDIDQNRGSGCSSPLLAKRWPISRPAAFWRPGGIGEAWCSCSSAYLWGAGEGRTSGTARRWRRTAASAAAPTPAACTQGAAPRPLSRVTRRQLQRRPPSRYASSRKSKRERIRPFIFSASRSAFCASLIAASETFGGGGGGGGGMQWRGVLDA